MPTQHVKFGDGSAGFIQFADPIRKITVAGKSFFFEDHRYFGPLATSKDGDPKARQPGPRSPFWYAWSLWFKQGKRVTDDGECIWGVADGERADAGPAKGCVE